MSKENTQSEYCAVLCLREYFPEFSNYIKRESPDFYLPNCSAGLEIIRAENEIQRKRLNMILKFYSPGVTRYQQERRLKQIKHRPVFFKQYDPCNEIKRSYLKKQEKLNEPQFQIFPSNYLAIIALLERFDKNTAKTFSDFLLEQQGKHKHNFDHIFVITYEYIITFSASKGDFEMYPMTQERYYAVNKQAADLVSKM